MIQGILASILGGVLLALAFPEFSLSYTAWFALIPVLWAIHRNPQPLPATVCGAVFLFCFFLIDVRWVFRTVVLHGGFGSVAATGLLLGMVVVLGVYGAVFGYLTGMLARRGFAVGLSAPFVLTALEYARSHLFTGFPWDLVGYSQNAHPILTQIADITGVYGISFMVFLVNGTLWEIVRSLLERRPFPRKGVIVTCATAVIVIVYGTLALNSFEDDVAPSETFRIGVLQANIPQEIKWARKARDFTFNTYAQLSSRAAGEGARLIVWPETSIPVILGSDDPAWKTAGAISERVGVPLLAGAPSLRVEDGTPRYFNSAFLFEGRFLRFRYDKIHLVPFGEYMPLSTILPVGPGLASVRDADYTAGRTMEVMEINGSPPFSVLICYEAIFPDLSRTAVNNGASLLVNITNDGWFGGTAAPYQHFQMARLRSVENRTWMIRCANTGISALFSPTGKVVEKIPMDDRGFFMADVPVNAAAGSFYSRYGDVFALGCCVMTVVLFIAGVAMNPRLLPRNPDIGGMNR